MSHKPLECRNHPWPSARLNLSLQQPPVTRPGANVLLLLSLPALLLAGCFGLGGPLATDPHLETATDESGKAWGADTQRYWRDWTEIMDEYVKQEASGQEITGGLDSWNTRWLRIIKAVRGGRENAERYVRYIVENRRSAGLPELVFEDGN